MIRFLTMLNKEVNIQCGKNYYNGLLSEIGDDYILLKDVFMTCEIVGMGGSVKERIILINKIESFGEI